MLLFPAIDLYDRKVVRLLRGDYREMTVYSSDPVQMARDIQSKGAKWLHLVDLEGAREGTTPNFPVVKAIAEETGLKLEIGGGIRTQETIRRYLEAGVERVILGTRAAEDPGFLREALENFGAEHIAVGVDSRDGRVAVKGWTTLLETDMYSFIQQLGDMGVKYIIVTDISRDGAMQGTNLPLYENLSRLSGLCITASGGVSSCQDIVSLRDMGLYGAILGKAMYTGAVELEEAVRLAEGAEHDQ